MANTYRIQVLTKTYVPELGYEYSDGQYLVVPADMSLEQVKTTYEADILAEESKRIQARIYEKNNPPVQVPPTKAQLQAEKAELLTKIADLDSQISAKEVVK